MDHGKTELVKALTGIDCDTHKEEKRRGITINLGFTHLVLPSGETIGIVDVPGHRSFVHTMVAGASGIDLALLVVAADSGVMPQTHEHLSIMDILGVRNGLVALTKVDLVEGDVVDLAEDEVREATTGTFLEGCPVVRVSSVTGVGIDLLKACIGRVSSGIPDRATDGCFRMFIDRVFTVKGFGTVATGSVLSGVLRTEDAAYLLPGARKLRVRRLERHGREVQEVVGGDRASVNLVGIDLGEFQRGMAISDRVLDATSMVDAKLELFPSFRGFSTVWNQVVFHLGTYEYQVRVHLIDCNRLRGGEAGLAQIHFEIPCVVRYGDRFVMRNSASDTTIGGGMVIDAFPLHHRRRTDTLVGKLKRIAEGKVAETIASEVRKRVGVVTDQDLSRILSMDQQRIFQECKNLPDDIACYEWKGMQLLMVKRGCEELREKITESLETHRRQHVLSTQGLSVKELIGMVGVDERSAASETLLRLLLSELESEGRLRSIGERWALHNHDNRISADLNRKIQLVANYLKKTGMRTPPMREIVAAAKEQAIGEQSLKEILHYLVQKKEIYSSDDNFIHGAVVDNCRTALLKALTQRTHGMTVAEFRDLVSGNRKTCLVLLGIFDGEGIVDRVGDLRVITEAGKQLLKG